MKKQFTLAAAALLAAGTLSAQAQITLNGTIAAAEIGTGNDLYQLLGRFTTPHVFDKGFGNYGLLSMYAANGGANNGKFYIALAGTLEKSGNAFEVFIDRPTFVGVPVGVALPNPNGMTVFDGVAGTKLELAADMALAIKGDAGGQIPQAVFYTTAATASSREFTPVLPLAGTAVTLTASQATGAYAGLAGARMAYKDTQSGSLVTDFPGTTTTPPGPLGPGNPGNTATNPGSGGSFGWEIELDRNNLGIGTGGGQVRLMGAYVAGSGFFSSDIIPEVTGNGNTNVGNTPDFTTLPGTQSAGFTVTLSSRQEDEAAVAMSVFPNPSLSQAVVTYRVLSTAKVGITLTDLLGRTVKSYNNGVQSEGIKSFPLNNSDVAAGTYLVKVQVGDKVSTRKVVLL